MRLPSATDERYLAWARQRFLEALDAAAPEVLASLVELYNHTPEPRAEVLEAWCKRWNLMRGAEPCGWVLETVRETLADWRDFEPTIGAWSLPTASGWVERQALDIFLDVPLQGPQGRTLAQIEAAERALKEFRRKTLAPIRRHEPYHYRWLVRNQCHREPYESIAERPGILDIEREGRTALRERNAIQIAVSQLRKVLNLDTPKGRGGR